MEPKKLAVSIKEAAEIISVSPRTINKFVSSKRLPSRKLGRRTVILMRDLEVFLKKDQPVPGET